MRTLFATLKSTRPAQWLTSCVCLAAILCGGALCGSSALGQSTAYIGYAYPAGGQQGTTFRVKLGGQRLSGAHQVLVSGSGVSATVAKAYPRLSNQEMVVLREQLNALRPKFKGKGKSNAKATPGMSAVELRIRDNIEGRLAEYCNRPASTSIADLVFVDITIAADAEPGPRELRVVAEQGISNPLVFVVGQLPEVARKPMLTSSMQVLGKEELALRKRPTDEAEVAIDLPRTVNGQIASGEVNVYRFQARKGQRLVISCAARELIPFIADAVPGWFQPVISVSSAQGEELSYNDDFGFKPDPTLLFEVPADGEYRLRVFDALYRGREDFVYRISIGELPLLTGIFPLGGNEQTLARLQWQGWNVKGAQLKLGARDEAQGIQWVSVVQDGLVSNCLPFLLSEQAATSDTEPNNSPENAQQVALPAIINGRIDSPGDWDVFEVAGVAGQPLVAEVLARRLDSPLDSILKVTDRTGQVLFVNDDHADVASGLNTHHADSYLMFTPAVDGPIYVHLGDTSRSGGEAFAYRLRISRPQPDFELRVTPSNVGIRPKNSVALSVYAIRKDGYDGDIKIQLGGPKDSFSMSSVTLTPEKDTAKLYLKTTLRQTAKPVPFSIQGQAVAFKDRAPHEAVPADDRMQAFLWRHLVPAQDLAAVVLLPRSADSFTRPVPPAPRPSEVAAVNAASANFTKKQAAGRLKQLRSLFEEWFLTDEFYNLKVAECEAVQ